MIFLFGFIVPGINNWAHGGGLLGGILLGFLLGYQEKQRELWKHKALALICFWATLGVLLWAIASAIFDAPLAVDEASLGDGVAPTSEELQ